MFEKKIYRSDMLRCALCHDAPCTAACGKLDPAGLLRSIWFDDEINAAASLPDINPCAGCSAPCEAECVRPHQVPIKSLVTRLYDQVRPEI
ncbi:MAG: NAD-dependent dihydropyrimidine dehydrogenase subunit PreA, partial [Spirochaetia bacterium]|nr:NAD-dependent dihydropyrimidine dehydrogenase subunit PreA [Spirochaetia bacterium]